MYLEIRVLPQRHSVNHPGVSSGGELHRCARDEHLGRHRATMHPRPSVLDLKTPCSDIPPYMTAEPADQRDPATEQMRINLSRQPRQLLLQQHHESGRWCAPPVTL